MTPTGDEIRRSREAKGLSVYALARLAKVRWVTIKNWEVGRRHPRLSTTRKVVEALNAAPPIPMIDAD